MVMKLKPARRKCKQCGHYFILRADDSQEFIDSHLCPDCWDSNEFKREDFEEEDY